MNPVPFKESNFSLGAGDNPSTDDMPVAVSKNEAMSGERLHCISFWKLSPEEMREITNNGGVWVSNMAWPPPPVMIMAENPFTTHGFKPLDIY